MRRFLTRFRKNRSFSTLSAESVNSLQAQVVSVSTARADIQTVTDQVFVLWRGSPL